MKQKAADVLYETWLTAWRPRTNDRQTVLAWCLVVLVPASLAVHWLMLVSPQMAGSYVRLELPYEAWYLKEQPPIMAKDVSAGSPSDVIAPSPAVQPTTVQKGFLTNRPNLVPQSQDWNARTLQQSLLGHLNQKAQDYGKKTYAISVEASAVAQEMAERYALGGAQAVQEEYETSLLAGGWLWDVHRGCEASVYSRFPSKSIEQMGCGPRVLPDADHLGLGVAQWRTPEGQSIPVFALVWQIGSAQGGMR